MLGVVILLSLHDRRAVPGYEVDCRLGKSGQRSPGSSPAFSIRSGDSPRTEKAKQKGATDSTEIPWDNLGRDMDGGGQPLPSGDWWFLIEV